MFAFEFEIENLFFTVANKLKAISGVENELLTRMHCTQIIELRQEKKTLDEAIYYYFKEGVPALPENAGGFFEVK